MDEILEELRRVTDRAKAARNVCMGVTAPDTLAAHDLATDLAQIGQEFIGLSIRLRQAGREAADAAAVARKGWRHEPKLNAKRAADAIVKAGGYRVPA